MGKDSVITLRVSEDDKQRLLEDSELSGLSLSELIRSRYFGKKIIPKVEYVLINELRRLGGLLKSNFQTMREAGVSQNLIEDQQIIYKKIVELLEIISMDFQNNDH